MWLWIAGLMTVATIFFELGKFVGFSEAAKYIPKDVLESVSREKFSWLSVLGIKRRN